VATAAKRILQPGDTCWRIETARRFAFIVDAGDYFAHAKQAMLNARHRIVLIGWDFDLRIKLTPGSAEDGFPDELGAFLQAIVRRRRELEIFILKWDMAVLYTLSRQLFRLVTLLDIRAWGRIHFRLDSEHPTGAAHHQKIVVIDDALAFCGGIDMTDDRWDTSRHAPADPRRRRPNGTLYGPWHDTTTAVDSEVAEALGELARERWRLATGRRLRPVPRGSDPWPKGLEPILRDVQVAIARTAPAYHGRPQVDEIERLYLEAIGTAQRTIYLESQYFASARIGAAIAARLREPDGPEVVVVNPLTAEGWLEEEVMGTARDLLVRWLAQADRHGRFRIYHPVNETGEPIYVHAKVLAVDDRLFRVGSSNINNRSMGFDTECDLALEAGLDDTSDDVGPTILRLRNDLVAEHLGVPLRHLAATVDGLGSLGLAIERLRTRQGRTLVPLTADPVGTVEEILARSRLADPERPRRTETRLQHLVKLVALRVPPGPLIGLGAGLVLGATIYALGRHQGRRAASSAGRSPSPAPTPIEALAGKSNPLPRTPRTSAGARPPFLD
jgi:phospholipase D1/2